uniref:Putative secreted protein n=1 Tax=Ixodes ricinus TaxID=34613 RepID=A0A6B0UN89_IXORI
MAGRSFSRPASSASFSVLCIRAHARACSQSVTEGTEHVLGIGHPKDAPCRFLCRQLHESGLLYLFHASISKGDSAVSSASCKLGCDASLLFFFFLRRRFAERSEIAGFFLKFYFIIAKA